ncbi:hypothetical protein [Rhizobium sp. BK176]|uniref:hypothetical protein n=1 Tax=Rhizobium sp. BK176 TaxID=2587071 RepID=UPI00216776E4|nr:hypothetical protein [Rhizobium sp. BK176]MCS4089665.1 hypothetical protein [Rhizobium sp. BK176]
MDTLEKKTLVDELMLVSTFKPDLKRALEVIAAVSADLHVRMAGPNQDTLQSARLEKIYKLYAPLWLDDPWLQEDLDAGLTPEDLADDARMFGEIGLRQAAWIRLALDRALPSREANEASYDQMTEVDALLASHNIEADIVIGLDAIGAMKASVYNPEPANFADLQDMRFHEILQCCARAEIAAGLTKEELASDPRELTSAVREWELMLHQAKWIAYALKSAGYISGQKFTDTDLVRNLEHRLHSNLVGYLSQAPDLVEFRVTGPNTMEAAFEKSSVRNRGKITFRIEEGLREVHFAVDGLFPALNTSGTFSYDREDIEAVVTARIRELLDRLGFVDGRRAE